MDSNSDHMTQGPSHALHASLDACKFDVGNFHRGNVSMIGCPKMGATKNHRDFVLDIARNLWVADCPALHAHVRI